MPRVSWFIIIGMFGLLNASYARFDPTLPPYYRDVESETIRKADLSVTAIIVSKDRKIAVVNDNIVRVGDTLSGLKIVDIDENQVKFFGHEGYFSVPLRVTIKQELSKEVENS